MDISTLLSHLAILYPSPSTPINLFPSQIQQAQSQKAIYDLMAEPSAWSLAGQILDSLGTADWAEDTNTRFIAAHTLAVKISRDWHSLPSDQYSSLKERLLHWLHQSAQRSSPSSSHDPARKSRISADIIVLRKLAVAVSALSLKLVPDPLKCWDHWLLETITRISSSGQCINSLLVVLTIVAEEAARADLIGPRSLTSPTILNLSRVQYDKSIQDGGSLVIRTLVDALKSDDSSTKISALTCSQAWLSASHLNIEGPMSLWPILLDLLTKSVYLSAYVSNDSTDDFSSEEEDIIQKTAECIEELVSSSNGGLNCGGGFVTSTRVVPLLDWYAGDLVGALIEKAVTTQEVPDAILAIFKLYVSLAEHSISHIAATISSSRSLVLLRRLLRITLFPGFYGVDEQVSALPLPIWTLLQEEITDMGYLGNIEDTFQDNLEQPHDLIESTKKHKSLSNEIFKALTEGLKVKSRWPKQSELSSLWTKDRVSAFQNQTRVDIGEALLACYYVRRDEMLADLTAEVKYLVDKPQVFGENYEDLEACLFCLRAIQEGIPLEESTCLPALLSSDVLLKLPKGDSVAFTRLTSTCLVLIGGFSEWLKQRPEQLSTCLNWVAPSLSSCDVDVVSLAATAFRRLCHEGRKTLVNDIASLAQLIRSTEGRIPSDEYNKVLQSVASVLQALSPISLVEPLLSLLGPVITRLDYVTRLYSETHDAEHRMVIIDQLRQLKAANSGLSEPDEGLILLDLDDSNPEQTKANELASLEPIQSMRTSLADLICKIIRLSVGDVDLAIDVTELLRTCTSHGIPTAMSLDPFLILINCVSNLSNDRTNLAIWFSLSTSLMVAISRSIGRKISPEKLAMIVECVKESARIATEVLGSDAAMKHHPDIVQTFLQFCVAVTESYIEVFASLHDELQSIVTIAIRGLKIEERIALQAALDILKSFAQHTRPNANPAQSELFVQLLTVHSYDILNGIVFGIGGGLPRSALPSLAETIHCFFIRLPETSRACLTKLFEMPGYPSEKVNQERKAKFIQGLCSARTLKKARDLCTEFAILARGLEGTAYGASQLHLSFN
ncbi:armadillo-type protein [Melampsora americana]|nr:armadillo-type protein [Melampsora americana]